MKGIHFITDLHLKCWPIIQNASFIVTQDIESEGQSSYFTYEGY